MSDITATNDNDTNSQRKKTFPETMLYKITRILCFLGLGIICQRCFLTDEEGTREAAGNHIGIDTVLSVGGYSYERCLNDPRPVRTEFTAINDKGDTVIGLGTRYFFSDNGRDIGERFVGFISGTEIPETSDNTNPIRITFHKKPSTLKKDSTLTP